MECRANKRSPSPESIERNSELPKFHRIKGYRLKIEQGYAITVENRLRLLRKNDENSLKFNSGAPGSRTRSKLI